MRRNSLLISAYALDHLLGDPEWFPHPVRLMGLGITHGERALRRDSQSNNAELVLGGILTLSIVSTSYAVTAYTIRRAYQASPLLGAATELLLAWTCLAARNLQQEATTVTAALDLNDLPQARTQLARIVGRDTISLNTSEVSRAVIETLAESACDGTFAPLFYLALGGVPLAMAYKAVNTLDSMIGHADDRYFYFGKIAARLDDAANYLPARLTALALCASAAPVQDSDSLSAFRTWKRDGHLHKSPNAGQPESAISGALRVQLGGTNHYAGEPIDTPKMGCEFQPATIAKAHKAIKLVSVASLIGVLIFAACARGKRA